MTENVLLFASSKGGVGKSTVALGLARALAQLGQRVLLADFDFSSPCLDLLCGMEDHVLCTAADLANGICTPADALLRPYDALELYLLPASHENSLSDTEESDQTSLLTRAVEQAAEQIGAEYVLLDTGAGLSKGLRSAAAVAHSAVIVAGHTPASIRAAGMTGQRMLACGIADTHLVINPFDVKGCVARKNARHSMLEIIDGAGVPLLGAVPYDYALVLAQEGHGSADLSAVAFQNIAARLRGQAVPLFSGMSKIRKQKRMLFQ